MSFDSGVEESTGAVLDRIFINYKQQQLPIWPPLISW